jgi:DNA-binding MarR family transcriptional regulator
MDIKQFIQGINFIRAAVHKDIAMPQLAIFLLVAENDGITQTEIAERFNMPQGTVSRNVAKLGHLMTKDSKGNWKQMGYELVENIPDQHETRRNAVFLTNKGKQIIKGLKKAIK